MSGLLDVDAVRSCPVCRKFSPYVLPANAVPVDDAAKEEMLASYASRRGAILCKHFDMGRGTCRFGDSCAYKHVYPDGSLAQRGGRWVVSESSAARAVTNLTLFDFIK